MDQSVIVTKRPRSPSIENQAQPPTQNYNRSLAGTSGITDDLVNIILHRLPVKHLLRCRAVSKPWCSLIDSTTFVEEHLKRNIECNADSCIVFLPKARPCFYLADLDSSCQITATVVKMRAVKMLNASKPPLSSLNCPRFVGTCNGLVCVWNDGHKKFNSNIYLWNPATREAKKLPKQFLRKRVPFPALLTGSSIVGFGYDPLSDDYKVVTSIDSKMLGVLLVSVYSLKGNSWTRVESITNKYQHDEYIGMYANGSVYWQARKDSNLILAFDLGVERHKELSYPAGAVTNDGDTMGLTVLNRCLCLVDFFFDHVDIWLMNNSGVENSWSKLFSVEQASIYGLPYDLVWPVAFSKSRNDILLKVGGNKLIWYDHVRNEVEKIKVDGSAETFDLIAYKATFDLIAYTESLVKPGCKVQVNGEEQKTEEQIKEEEEKKLEEELKKDKLNDYLFDGYTLTAGQWSGHFQLPEEIVSRRRDGVRNA